MLSLIHMHRWTVVSLLALVCMMTLVTGCGQQYDESDVIGTWVSSDGGKMVFKASTFRVEDIPMNMLTGSYVNSTKECSGSGTWSIEGHYIDLNYSDIDGKAYVDYHAPVYLTRRDEGMILWFSTADPNTVGYKLTRSK
jgi:hypothetical protein